VSDLVYSGNNVPSVGIAMRLENINLWVLNGMTSRQDWLHDLVLFLLDCRSILIGLSSMTSDWQVYVA